MNLPSKRKLGAATLIVAGIAAFMVPFLLHSPTTQGTSPNPTTTSGNNNGSHSAKDTTSSRITCSPNAIVPGGTSTCSATIPDMTTATDTPSGTVSFTSSNAGVGTVAASCTLSAGSCTVDFNGVAVGTAAVTGAYSGDSGHNGSSGTSNSINVANASGNDGNGSGSGCTETKSSDSQTSDPGHDNGQGKDQGNAYGLLKNKMDTTISLVKAMGRENPAFHLHHDTDTDNDAVHGASHNAQDPADHDSSCASGEEEHEQD